MSPELREESVLLAAFLLSSGRRLLEEPAEYAVYRLIEGGRRALALLESCGGSDPQLVSVRDRLDDIVHAPPAQHDFAGLLDDVCQQLVKALKCADPAADR